MQWPQLGEKSRACVDLHPIIAGCVGLEALAETTVLASQVEKDKSDQSITV